MTEPAEVTRLRAENKLMRLLLRDVDLHGQAFRYHDPKTGEDLVLDPREVTVFIRHDAVRDFERLRKLAEAAGRWRDRVAGLILGSHEMPLADAVDEWRASRG